ncbi:hypothetical protein Tco_1318525, partial [Tanacetum coccineum]
YDSGGASGSGAGGSRGTDEGDADEGDADEGLDLVVDDTSSILKETADFPPATCRWGKCFNQTFPQRHVAGEYAATVAPILLAKSAWDPQFSLGIVVGELFSSSLPRQLFPSDMSLGKGFPI